MKRTLPVVALIVFVSACLFAELPALSGPANGELISLRSRTAKTFMMPDGNLRSILSPHSIHYQKDGQWLDIDTEIERINGRYQNLSNSVEIIFPDTPGMEGLRLSHGGGKLEMFVQPELIVHSIHHNVSGSADPSGNMMRYVGDGGVLLDLRVVPDGLVKTVMIPAALAQEGDIEFRETIRLPYGWFISENQTGGLCLFDNDRRPVFFLPPPTASIIMNRPRTLPLDMEVSNTAVGEFLLTVHCKRSLYSEYDGSYTAILIDPTVTCYPVSMDGTGFIENWLGSIMRHGTYDPSYSGDMIVGSVDLGMGMEIYERGWCEFNIGVIPTSLSSVTDVVLHINSSNCNNFGAGCNMNTGFYSMTVQPSTADGTSTYYGIGSGTLYASRYISSNGWFTIDLGPTADSNLYSARTGSISWFALGIREVTESGFGYEVRFNGSESAYVPYLEVTYNNDCPVGTWTGAASTTWSSSANWCAGVVPTSSIDVTIPSAASTPNDPTITAGASCRDMDIAIGGILNGGSGTLSIYGNWTNNGIFSGGTGSINFSSSADQTISGAGVCTFYILRNTKTAGVLYLSKNISVSGRLFMVYPSTTHRLDMTSRHINFGS